MAVARRSFIYGKVNMEPVNEDDYDNPDMPYYDPKGKYGDPIVGGINNGYEEKDLINFWIKIQGFCSYLFNRSHKQ